jgi:catechol 2,3-dioxygenase
MSDETQAAAAPSSSAALPDGLRLGAVDLTVTDLDRSVGYYRNVVGLEPAEHADGVASLSSGGGPLVVLHEDRNARPAGRHAGLFHFALLQPTREELAHAAVRIGAARAPLAGASDHGVSEALYLRDPDGNGIEIYADRPRAQWPPAAPGDRIGMFTAPLDIDGLLATIAGENMRPAAGPGLVMGHVHLQVGDIGQSEAFYRALGFERMVGMPSAAFLAAGDYHHHLGLNVWQGLGIPPAPPDSVGLRRWTVILPDAGDVTAAAQRLRAAGVELREEDGGVLVRDPSQIELSIRAQTGA